MQIGQQYFWTSWGPLLYSVRTGEQAFPELYGVTAWEYQAAHPDEDAVFNATMTKGEMLQSCCNPSGTHPDRAGKQ
jgi:hypothetical protein